jgi:antirestriction protein ArdC
MQTQPTPRRRSIDLSAAEHILELPPIPVRHVGSIDAPIEGAVVLAQFNGPNCENGRPFGIDVDLDVITRAGEDPNEILCHELVHAWQWFNDPAGFMAQARFELATQGYHDAPYEVEARTLAAMMVDAGVRVLFPQHSSTPAEGPVPAAPTCRAMARRKFTAEERAEYRAQKRTESRELLESAARELLSSDGWRRYAETRAAFHRYSVGNCMLIAMQCPEATRVAGFRKWQELGRQVRKGEKSIRILAPHTYKRVDERTGEEAEHVYFRAVAVFDVTQTDGEPLPEPPCEPLTGDSHAAMLPRLERFAASIGWTVEYGETGSADGYAAPIEQRIRINSELTEPNRRVRTLVHELVHALGIGYREYGREVAEVLTETAAFVACRSIGLDTAGMSVPYVASWGEEGDLDAIKTYAGIVDAMAQRIEEVCA